jgi:hypothetical protein
MVLCTDPNIETWTPNFTESGLANPTRERLTFRGKVLCNSLGSVDWLETPTQVEICDHCGTPGCASGGYVHVSRVGDLILWTSPQISDEDDFARGQHTAAWPRATFSALVFPRSTWIDLAAKFLGMPLSDQVVDVNGRAICDAWMHRAGPDRPPRDLAEALRVTLVACDTLDNTAAFDAVDHWLDRLLSLNSDSAPRLLASSHPHGQIETLYFDGPGSADWAAFALIEGRPFP